jgi:hypothetical protein
VFSGVDGWWYISRLIQRFPLPAAFVEHFMTNVPDDEKTIGRDLEFLRRVCHWYLHDVEEC